MPSLQEQIAFVQNEYERYKCVEEFLFKEFGEKCNALLTKDISEKIRYSDSIITSLEELKTIKSLFHEFRK
jgi:hypothetical protein